MVMPKNLFKIDRRLNLGYDVILGMIRKNKDDDFINIWKEQKLATNFFLGE